jgi:hypothetical protein
MLKTVLDKILMRPPALAVVLQKRLDAHRHALLEAQDARDYAGKLCEYHEARIKMLEKQDNAV